MTFLCRHSHFQKQEQWVEKMAKTKFFGRKFFQIRSDSDQSTTHFRMKISISKKIPNITFLWRNSHFSKKREPQLQSSLRTERPDQTLALMFIIQPGQTRLRNSIRYERNEMVPICSLGNISAIVEGFHQYDDSIEWLYKVLKDQISSKNL